MKEDDEECVHGEVDCAAECSKCGHACSDHDWHNKCCTERNCECPGWSD